MNLPGVREGHVSAVVRNQIVEARSDSQRSAPQTHRPWFLKAQLVLLGTGTQERISVFERALPDFGGQLMWKLTSLADSTDIAQWPAVLAELLDPWTDLVLVACIDRNTAQALAPTLSTITGSLGMASVLIFEEQDYPEKMPDHSTYQMIYLSCPPGEIVTQVCQLAYVLFSPALSRSFVSTDWSNILSLLKTRGEAQLSWGTADSVAAAKALARKNLHARGFGSSNQAVLAVIFARQLSLAEFEHAKDMVKDLCDEDAFVLVAAPVIRWSPTHFSLFVIRHRTQLI